MNYMTCGCNLDIPQKELVSQPVSQKLLNDNFNTQKLNTERLQQTSYKNTLHSMHTLEVLDSFRKDEILCDIKLQTDDGVVVCGHKVILASVSPYFKIMFTNFEESKKDHVILRELESSSLKLIIDFIYSGQIMVTEDNVQDVLHTANLLQLHDVKEACCDFLQTQRDPENCLGFKILLSLHDCVEYLPSFTSYILQNFSKVVESEEFLSLSYEQVVEIISSDELNDPSEEKVFESVVNWVNHNLSTRKNIFPKLMEHVRLPLASKEYLLNKVKEEPLLINYSKCKDYLIEALHFHLLKFENPGIFLGKIRTKRRLVHLPKQVILAVGRERGTEMSEISKSVQFHWYDSSTNRWQLSPEISIPQIPTRLVVLNDHLLFFLSGSSLSPFDGKVYILDLFAPSPCLKPSPSMINARTNLGVGVLDNCIYAIGGVNRSRSLKSAEVFNHSTQKWQMISEMYTGRHSFGVGVLNNHIYAIGGYNHVSRQYLKSVEKYCPKSNTWIRVSDMNVRRCDVRIGVLNGIMYAVGGFDGMSILKSVEAYNPNSNIWTSVSYMHESRRKAVVAFDNLLYVFDGHDGHSAEIYNPRNNIWNMLSETMNIEIVSEAVAINQPPHLKI